MINPYAFSRAASTIAGKHGLSVQFSQDVEPGNVRVNGSTVYLPTLTSEYSQDVLDSMLAKVDYFGSLWRYNDDDQARNLKELPSDQPIGYMYRLFNDARIQRTAADEFLGSRSGFSADIAAQMGDITGYMPGLDPKQQAVLTSALESMSDWNAGVRSSELRNAMTPEGRDMIAKLDSESIIDMARVLKNGGDPLALAKECYRLLWQDDPDEQEQQERGGGDGASEDGEDDTERGGNESKMDGGANPMNSSHSKISGLFDPDAPEGEVPCSVKVPVDEEYPYKMETDLDVIDLRRERVANQGYVDTMDYYVREAGGRDTSLGAAVFANRIRRHIMAKSQAEWEHGTKRGKLSGRNLYKLCMPSEVQGPDTERVFKRKIDNDTLDTAVYLMIDMSGSMAGEPTGYTYKATCLLTHAFQTLNIPLEVAAFTTKRKTEIYTIKHWSERVTEDQLFNRFCVIVEQMRNNNDSAALLYAHDRLLMRPEKRKILIMQSDGQPCDGGVTGNATRALRDSVKHVESLGLVDLLAVGVGFCGRDCTEYYSQHVVIENVDQLEIDMFKLISGKIA